jgi:sulfonate transport system substrate-binding protein
MTAVRIAAFTALLLIGAVAAGGPVPAAATLRVGYQLSSTLIAVLKANGELEKELGSRNIAVTWHEFTSGLPVLEALNTGNIDFSADVAETVPIFALAAGAKFVFVAEEAASPQAQAIVVPAKSPIRTLADLKGRKIAVTKGAGTHYLLIAALRSAGMTYNDIVPAYLTPADGRAAFANGSVDAWVAWDPYLTTTQRLDDARVLIDSKGLATYKRYYLAALGYARAHGDVLKLIYDKLDATGQWVKSHPDDAGAILADLWHIDRGIAAEAIGHRSYKIGPVTKDGLAEQKEIAATFLEAGLLPRPIDASKAAVWNPETGLVQ